MKYLEKWRWDNCKLRLYDEDKLRNSKELQDWFEEVYYFELEDEGDKYSVSLEDAWNDYNKNYARIQELKEELAEISKRIKTFADKTRAEGLEVHEFGSELLEAVDTCGWNTSTMTSDC